MAKKFELIDKETKQPLDLVSLDVEANILGFIAGEVHESVSFIIF